MNCLRLDIALLFSFLLVLPLGLSSQVEISIHPDTNRVMVGTPLNFTVQMRFEKEATFDFPDMDAPFAATKEVEITGASQWDTIQFDPVYVVKMELACIPWDTGVVLFKTVEVPYVFNKISEIAKSENIFIRVLTPSTDDDQDIFSIKDIIRLDKKPFNYIWLIGIGIFLIAFFFFLRYILKKKAPPAQSYVPEIPTRESDPIDEAIAELEKLKEQATNNNWPEKDYYSQMTHIIRVYLSKTLQYDALNLPTTDMIKALSSVLTPIQTEALRGLMYRSDMVKFAKAMTAKDIRSSSVQDTMVTLKEIDQQYYRSDKIDPPENDLES